MVAYAQHVSTRQTPQSEAVPGKPMVENSAGGFSFAVDDWTRLNRFLILGNEGGSYYASERKLTIENATSIRNCFAADPKRTVDTIVGISDGGRAPKNDPAIFALAMCCAPGPHAGYALDAMPKVCRTGTHLFQFVNCVQAFRGWGRALRRAVANWYSQKTPNDLSYQVTKYQSREGWTHHDVLHHCHAKSPASVLQYAKDCSVVDGAPEILSAVERAKRAESATGIVRLIESHGLVREHIPTQWLNSPEVWDALLSRMPLTALVRNLGKMSAIGLLAPMSAASQNICARLSDQTALVRARVHPLSILVAQKIYAQGHGDKGKLSWQPVPQVTDALDSAFYLAFKAVEPTNKRWMLALDVSGSMSYSISGMPLSCRDASGAMAMVTAKTEPQYMVMAFSNRFMPIDISRAQRLPDVIRSISNLPFQGTDCSLPMLYALQNRIPVDAFVVYTDSETWAGQIHPCQALQEYRNRMGIGAKLIVCGMVSNGFTIADPSDAGMLDVVGFDTSVPQVMGDFVR